MRAWLPALPIVAAGLLAACSAPPPGLPPSPASAKAAEDGFAFTALPQCTADAVRAFEAPEPSAIESASGRGVPFDCRSAYDQPLLSRAVIEADVERVIRMLVAGANPNGRWGGHGDRLPLQEAIECRRYGPACEQRLATVRALLQGGADPNARWCEFESRLGVGKIPGCTSSGGWTPLVAAAAMDAADLVYVLLDAGADPWLTTGEGAVALDMARSLPVFELLRVAMFPDPATRTARARQFWQEREWPAWNTDPMLQTRLTAMLTGAAANMQPPPPPPPDANVRVEVKTLRDWLPGVHYVRARDGRAGLVRALIDDGDDPNQRLTGRSDWTPLMLALAYGDHYSASVLLDAGADPNARACGAYPGGWMSDRPPFEAGCTVDAGLSPLMLAAARAAVDTMRLLLARGADLSARDWRGRSVADYAPAEARDAIMRAARQPAALAPPPRR